MSLVKLNSIDAKRKTNWTKCCLCQQDTEENLVLPKRKLNKTDAGYSNLARNIPIFYSLNAMPLGLDPARLDDGDGIEETLRKNDAQYHKSCKLLFNNTKLQRAQKRTSILSELSSDPEEGCCTSKLPRKSHDQKAIECFLCEKPDTKENLRQAMTMQLTERINQCAMTRNDGRLLARLSAGDAVAQELKYHPGCLVTLYNRERGQKNAENYRKRP